MKKIVIIILSLVILLLPAMPLHAEDWTPPTEEECDALLEAAEKLGSDRVQAENTKLRLSLEIIDQEKETDKAENEKRECEEKLKICLSKKDREIKTIEEKVSELEQELVGDKVDVDNYHTQYEQAELEIQQWAADHSILGMLGGQGAQIAAVGVGSWILSKRKIASKLLGPIGYVADAIGIGLTLADRLHFEELIYRANDAAERLREAQTKWRETGEALDRWKERLSKGKIEREAACPDERKRLEEAEEQYNKVQGKLDELRQQLEKQRRKIDELNRKIPEAWADWEECRKSMMFTHDLTVTASKGGKVTLSSKRGTFQVSAGNTGKGPVTQGIEVTLTAVSEGGYFFTGWSGDASGTANPIIITMNWDKRVTAYFSMEDQGTTPTPPPPTPPSTIIPQMTGPPTIMPSNVPNGQSVTVSVPVTTNTNHVAIRAWNPKGSLSILTYRDGQLGNSVVVILTPGVAGNIGEQHWLEVYVRGEDENVLSHYTRNASKSTSYYTVTYNDGAGNTSESVTNIPIQWLTIIN